MPKATRQEVYAALDTERLYQDQLPATRSDGAPRTVADYITMLSHYQAEAIRAWTTNPGDAEALEVIRKIGGIAVHCMEDHGAPPRR